MVFATAINNCKNALLAGSRGRTSSHKAFVKSLYSVMTYEIINLNKLIYKANIVNYIYMNKFHKYLLYG